MRLARSHKRSLVSCASVLLLGAASVVSADDMTSFATGGYASALRTVEMMNKIDLNNDHMVSKAEWDGYQAKLFEMMDADKSGVLDHGEFMEANGDKVVSFATGGYVSALRSKEMLAKIDSDNDGKVTRAEFSAFQDKVFESMDTSKKQMVDQYQFFGKPATN
jgi:hypothetical protein